MSLFTLLFRPFTCTAKGAFGNDQSTLTTGRQSTLRGHPQHQRLKKNLGRHGWRWHLDV